MRRDNRSMIGLYMIGIVALFMAGFMLLIVFGAHIYRDTVQGQNQNNEMRAVLAYLQASVQGHGEDDIEIREDADFGQVLVIPESGTRYGQRIYRYEGNLVNDYNRLDRALAPEDADVLGQVDSFEIRERGRGLISVSTEAGMVLLHLGREGGVQ